MAGNDTTHFSTWDYVVFTLVLSAAFAVGVVAACLSKRRHLPEQFLIGSRRLSVIPVSLSMTMSFTVAITTVATTTDVYMYNTMFLWICLAYVIGGVLVCRIFIPLFFELKLVSVYEYVELRFNKTVRIFCSLLFILQMMIYLGIVLYVPSLILHTVTGINIWASITVAWTLAILYTALGGMTSIVWSDVFHFLVFLTGIITAIVMGANRVGGMNEVWRIAKEGERFKLAVVSLDPTVRHTLWSVLIGMTVIVVGTSSTNQTIVQRYLSLQSSFKARVAMALTTVLKIAMTSLCILLGLVVYAAYSLCDPYSSGKISRVDQITPYFVMEVFQDTPGLSGLFVASMFAVSMSSLSSGIHSLSAATGEDILKTTWPKLSDRKYGLAVQVSSIFYGLTIIGFACLAATLQESILPLTVSIFGVIGGIVLGIFNLGVFFHRSNSNGTLIGAILSLIVITCIKLTVTAGVPPLYDASALDTTECWTVNSTRVLTTEASLVSPTDAPRPKVLAGLFRLSYQYYSLFGLILTVALGMIASGCCGFKDPNTVDENLKLYMVDTVMCCMPVCFKDLVRRDGKHRENRSDSQTEGNESDDDNPDEQEEPGEEHRLNANSDDQETPAPTPTPSSTPSVTGEYETTTWL